MSHGYLYVVDGDSLRRMAPSAPENEDRMQTLVAQYPELITDGDGDLLLVAREATIGDGESQSRWSLDHLFVTHEAVPVLVELKRASDTRIRREVVGQLIDYAANASIHWAAGSIAASFAKNAGPDPDGQLAGFIGDRDPEEFWNQVDSNLRSGRIKLVFVADVIPRELAIVVEFLNSQMRADVRAIELRWFASEDGTMTLSPRVIGESPRSAATKKASDLPSISVDEWIQERLFKQGDTVVRGVREACKIAAELGGDVFIPTTRGSIIASWVTEEGKQLYPFGVFPSGMIILRLAYLKYRPRFASEDARHSLYNELTSIVGPLHTKSLSGEPGFPATKLNDEQIAERYRSFLEKVVRLGKLGEGAVTE